MVLAKSNHLVISLSAAGVLFILAGLIVLALPSAQEGMEVMQLDGAHALYAMDVIGMAIIGLGVILTWLSAQFWTRQLRV